MLKHRKHESQLRDENIEVILRVKFFYFSAYFKSFVFSTTNDKNPNGQYSSLTFHTENVHTIKLLKSVWKCKKKKIIISCLNWSCYFFLTFRGIKLQKRRAGKTEVHLALLWNKKLKGQNNTWLHLVCTLHSPMIAIVTAAEGECKAANINKPFSSISRTAVTLTATKSFSTKVYLRLCFASLKREKKPLSHWIILYEPHGSCVTQSLREPWW